MRQVAFLCVGFFGCFSAAAAGEDSLFDRLDNDKDGFVTAAEAGEKNKRLFDRMLRTSDKNKDGRLSRAEFTDSTTSKPKPTQPVGPTDRPTGNSARPQSNMAEIFKRIDRSGDGKISRDEAPEQMKANFDRIDANGDGAIDLTELGRAMAGGNRQPGQARPSAKELEQFFARADRNGDGKVSLDEVPAQRRSNFQKLLQRFDQDGDKAITKEQFIRALSETDRPMPGTKPASGNTGGRPNFAAAILVIRAIDANGDGELSAEEIANASQRLSKLDKNGDGKISQQDLQR